MHRSYGLQGSLKRRYKHPSPTSINGYHAAKKLLSQSPAKRPRLLSRAKVGTHSALLKGSRTTAHTPKHGAFRMGVSLPSTRTARSRTSPGRVSERRTLPLLGLGRVCSRRTQKAFGTAMRLCVSLSRGVAAPLGCVIFLQFGDVAVFFTLCAVLSECARQGGITTLGVLRMLLKRRTAACQSGYPLLVRLHPSVIRAICNLHNVANITL